MTPEEEHMWQDAVTAEEDRANENARELHRVREELAELKAAIERSQMTTGRDQRGLFVAYKPEVEESENAGTTRLIIENADLGVALTEAKLEAARLRDVWFLADQTVGCTFCGWIDWPGPDGVTPEHSKDCIIGQITADRDFLQESYDTALKQLMDLQDDSMPERLVDAVNYLIDHSNKGWSRVCDGQKLVKRLEQRIASQRSEIRERCTQLDKAQSRLQFRDGIMNEMTKAEAKIKELEDKLLKLAQNARPSLGPGPEPNEGLPTLDDVRELGPWGTDGKSAVDFVRSIRDEEPDGNP